MNKVQKPLIYDSDNHSLFNFFGSYKKGRNIFDKEKNQITSSSLNLEYVHLFFFSHFSKNFLNKKFVKTDSKKNFLKKFFSEYSDWCKKISSNNKVTSDYSYHYSYFLKKFLKQNKIKEFSFNLKILSKKLPIISYDFLYLNQNNIYEKKSLDIPLELFYPKKVTPFVISIDSEFVDKNNDQYELFENKRISYPLTVSVKIDFFTSNSSFIYQTYVFDIKHYLHLFKNVQNANLKKSLVHLPYQPSSYYQKNISDTSYKIKDSSCFKSSIEKILSYNGNYEETELFFFDPEHFKTARFKILKIPLIFYFCIKDLKYFFGSEIYCLIEPYLLTSWKVTFSNNGCLSPFTFLFSSKSYTLLFKIELIDLFGINSSGLFPLANIFNVEMKVKKFLDDYKQDMAEAIIKHPNIFIEYCFDDVIVLFDIYLKHFFMVDELYNNFKLSNVPCIFGFNDFNMKLTLGSFTAGYFEEYIYNQDFMLWKALTFISVNLWRGDFNQKDVGLIDGLELGSAKYLNRIGGSAMEGTFVGGGRNANEDPNTLFFENGLDADYSSCYGTGIISIPYCIGRPSVLRNDNGGFTYSLKTFLQKYKKELVPGCWYLVVGTKPGEEFNFNFDFLVSKIISSESLLKKIKEPNSMAQNMHLTGDQVILLKEAKHSIIVHETLEIIDNVSTLKEKHDLYEKLHVITAVFYPKKLQCKNPKQFIVNVSQYNKITKQNKKQKKNLELGVKDCLDDSRESNIPGYWFSINMNDFAGKLIEKRSELKKSFYQTNNNQDNSKQNFYKLIINTIYGVTASRFFKISNLCFANNVTGKAKISVWMMSKAFNLKQTITDGGIYEINKVLTPWNCSKKKPGFDKLTNIHTEKDKNTLKLFQPLGYGNYDWNLYYDKLKKDPNNTEVQNFISLVDNLANEHLKNFYNFFNMEPKYNIEHKPSNIFFRASTIGRAHYYLYTIFEKDIFKIRGTQEPKKESIASPIYSFLKNKAFADTQKVIEITELCYSQRNLLKSHNINTFKKRFEEWYINLDLSLHSTVITKKNFFIQFDTGKFKNYLQFKNLKSKKTDILSYCYLNINCIKKIDKNKLVINTEKFWNNFLLISSEIQNSKNFFYRFSKKDKKTLKEILEKAKYVDNNIEIPKDKDILKEDSEEIYKKNFEENYIFEENYDSYF